MSLGLQAERAKSQVEAALALWSDMPAPPAAVCRAAAAAGTLPAAQKAVHLYPHERALWAQMAKAQAAAAPAEEGSWEDAAAAPPSLPGKRGLGKVGMSDAAWDD